jgi:hypothetical protein
MKTNYLLWTAVILAAALAFASCDTGTGGSTGTGGNTGTGETLVTYNATAEGKEMVITITKAVTTGRSIISNNDDYTVRYEGAIIDRGKITSVTTQKMIFKSTGEGSPTFDMNLTLDSNAAMSITPITITQGAKKGQKLASDPIISASAPDLDGAWIGIHNDGMEEKLEIKGTALTDTHRENKGSWTYYCRGTLNFNGTNITLKITDLPSNEGSAKVGDIIRLTLAPDRKSFSLEPDGHGTFTKQ